MIEYRLGQPKDTGQLGELARTFFDLSGLSKYGATFNEAHVRDMLLNLIAHQDSLVLVAEHDGLIYGAIGAHLSHHIMNRDCGLVLELFQWVRPEARGHGVGGGLLDRLADWAKTRGAVTVAMMSIHNITGPAANQFQKRGYEAAETVWYKAI